jgi:superoxide reductase
MKRRNLVISALTGTAAMVALSRPAEAAAAAAWTNVIFTQDNPGHWKGKEASHAPVVEISGGKITVRTPHPMSEAHFIVSHSVALEDGTFVDRKTFTWKDQPVSEYSLPAGYKGGVIVASTCNLHDVWVKSLQI